MEKTEPSNETFLGHLWASIAATVILVILCCGAYPLVVWGLAQAIFPYQANGSLVKKDGAPATGDAEAVGSSLIGQNFTAAQYFHPRPSAAGNGYDAANSGGSNLGPLSAKLIAGVKDRVAAYRQENGLAADVPVPADAVTASSSGLDPHISPANADLQIPRVAKARHATDAEIRKFVTQYTDRPDWGVLGDARVNVLMLNLAIDAAYPVASK